ncbi:MAG: ABC transporter ATP-binding protein [Actinobacteria bacterium]|nr:ABC transporter ATP-binding protein [Actinomycetota bacterium]
MCHSDFRTCEWGCRVTHAVEVEGLTREYIMGGEPLVVLRGVTLSIEPGEIVCVMGPSGSGKSTLLNIVGGLDRPTAGTVRIEGADLAEMDDERLAIYRRKQVGFLFQSFNLIPTMTARRNVELPLLFAGASPAERTQRAVAALESVGLGHRIDHKPTELSGGEQQRAAMARAIVNEPAIVLADEPTGNLDSRTGHEILGLMREMNDAGRTLLITTHDRAIAESVADRIITIVDGSIESIEQGGTS